MSSKRKMILLVEANARTRERLAEFLMDSGYVVFGTGSPKQAFHLALSYHPDLVLLDPSVAFSGSFSLIKELRESEQTSTIPVVLLQGEDKTLGADGLETLSKPVDPKELLRVAQSRTPTRKGNVLIVDDSEEDRTLLAGVLGPNVGPIREAEDGKEALEILKSFTPDLIFLDVMMPRMDGFETLEAIRAIPGLEKVPVCVITARNLSLTEIRFFKDREVRLFGKSGELRKGVLRTVQRSLGS